MSNNIKVNVTISPGPKTDKDHIKTIKSSIEDIINIITSAICEKDKSQKYIDYEDIEQLIKNKYPEYLKLCVKASTDSDGKCESGTDIFDRDNLIKIVDSIQNNSLYIKMCKFKKNALFQNISVPLETISYYANILPLYLYKSKNYPLIINNMYSNPLYSHNYGLCGGNDNNDKISGKYNLGNKICLNGTLESIKYIDFDEFIRQYNDFNLYNSVENTNLRICKLNNDDIKCELFNFDKNNKQILEDIKMAYYGIERLNKLDNLEIALIYTEFLLKYLKYFILPLNTLQISEKINNLL